MAEVWSEPRALGLRGLARITRHFHPAGTKRLVRALHDPGDRPWSVSGIIVLPDGVRVHVDTASWIEWNLFFWGAYDARLRDFLGTSLAPGDTAVDVGANIGVHTLAMARAVGSGRVVACEPSPPVLERLRANLDLNGYAHVTVAPVAVSDQPGEVSLALPGAGESNQGTARVTREPGGTTVNVPAVTVDSLVESEGLDRVALIKVDVEGLDAAVLQGAAGTLARWRPRLVFEHDRAGWAAAGHELPATLRVLEGGGVQALRVPGEPGSGGTRPERRRPARTSWPRPSRWAERRGG